MALPIVIGVIAGVCALGGVGNGIHGGVKMKEAKDTMGRAEDIQKQAVKKLEDEEKNTTNLMDDVGKLEMTILSNFSEFCDLMEQIQGRPEFKEYSKDGVKLPKYEPEEIKKISSGAALVLGGLGGASVGTAGGFAAAGFTTAVVASVGTASTGTAISSLSGAALTNATLAALGGGSLASGGGGMALGSAVLGGAAAGAAILVGGIVFNVTGCKLSKKADEAYKQAKDIEKKVGEICYYLKDLASYCRRFRNTLRKVYDLYIEHVKQLKRIILEQKKIQWSEYNREEKLLVENTCLLVSMLYKMCNLNLVIKKEKDEEMNEVNKEGIDNTIEEANTIYETVESAA